MFSFMYNLKYTTKVCSSERILLLSMFISVLLGTWLCLHPIRITIYCLFVLGNSVEGLKLCGLLKLTENN